MSVHNIDDARPHLVLSCEDAVHVIPMKLAIGWANGEAPLPEDSIVRKVFTEWLLYLTGEQTDVIQMLREDNERIARHYLRVQSDYLTARRELEQARGGERG